MGALKLGSSTPAGVPGRIGLRDSIAKVHLVEELLAACRLHVDSLEKKSWAAQSAIEAYEKAVEESRGAFLLDGASLSPRQARQRLEEAIETLDDIKAARKVSEDKLRGLEQDLLFARSRVKDRVKEVVRAEPSVRHLCEKLEKLTEAYIDMRIVVQFLQGERVLPDEFKFILAEKTWPHLKDDKKWEAALKLTPKSIFPP